MVTIGRVGIRSLQTASNQGLARRIDNRLDATVDAQAARFKTALAVDGSVAFIFNKQRGVIACTCRGFANLNGFTRHEIGITGHEASLNEISYDAARNTHSAAVFERDTNLVKQVGGLNPTDLDEFFNLRNESVVAKIENNGSEFVDDDSPDILDALMDGEPTPIFSGDGDPMVNILAQTSLGNSTENALTPSMIACPICFGSSYVDSWQLYNGQRIVLDASNMYEIEIDNDIEIDSDSTPAVYTINSRSSIRWKSVAIPLMWRFLTRFAVFNRGEELNTNDYNAYFVHPSAPLVKNPLNYATLSMLKSSNLLINSNKIDIILESNKPYGDPLIFTHLEILFSLGQAVVIQVPEMEVPNDDEFVDWNLNVTFELPSDIEIRENSYIVESKYRRVWKVSSINRKLSARGKSFGYSVSARALHSFERQFVLMNLFGKPRNPFKNSATIEDMNDDDY